VLAPADVPPAGITRPSLLAKLLTNTVMKPLPYPSQPIVAPPRSDRVAFGRYLAYSLDCFSCHSADFKKVDMLAPEKSAGFMGGGNQLVGVNGNRLDIVGDVRGVRQGQAAVRPPRADRHRGTNPMSLVVHTLEKPVGDLLNRPVAQAGGGIGGQVGRDGVDDGIVDDMEECDLGAGNGAANCRCSLDCRATQWCW
jgi:hypothetical protein